jgi:hypothetical protein
MFIFFDLGVGDLCPLELLRHGESVAKGFHVSQYAIDGIPAHRDPADHSEPVRGDP